MQQWLVSILILYMLLGRTLPGQAQDSTVPHPDQARCTAMGDEMYIATVNRDRGLSPKADLDDMAHSIQNFGGIRDPDDTLRSYLVIVFNVRWNPAYQPFGPATIRLRAVSRCVHLGALAFWQELVAFQRTIMQK